MVDDEARQIATEQAVTTMGGEIPIGEEPVVQVKGRAALGEGFTPFHHPSWVVVDQILSLTGTT